MFTLSFPFKSLKRGFIFFLLLIFFTPCWGQKERSMHYSPPKHNVDIGLLGTGVLLSINYSQMHKIKRNQYINTSIGITPGSGGFGIPMHFTYNNGNCRFFEVGVSANLFFTTDTDQTSSSRGGSPAVYFSPLVLGYRNNFPSGLFIRSYINPMLRVNPTDNETLIDLTSLVGFFGLNVGYSF